MTVSFISLLETSSICEPIGRGLLKHRITPSIMSEYPDRRTFIAAGAAQAARSLELDPRSSVLLRDGTFVPFAGAEADTLNATTEQVAFYDSTSGRILEEILGTLFDEEAGLRHILVEVENEDLIVLSADPNVDGTKSGEHDGAIDGLGSV